MVITTGALGTLRERRDFRRQFARQRHQGSPFRCRGRDLGLVVNHLRSALWSAGGPQPALLVVSLQSDRAAALAVASTALQVANEGNKVLVGDLTATSALAELFQVRPKTTSAVRISGTDATLWVPPSGEAAAGADSSDVEFDERRNEADVLLALVTLDPAADLRQLRRWGTTAVAVATAGPTTGPALRSAGHILRSVRIRTTSAVLIAATSRHETIASERPLVDLDAEPRR